MAIVMLFFATISASAFWASAGATNIAVAASAHTWVRNERGVIVSPREWRSVGRSRVPCKLRASLANRFSEARRQRVAQAHQSALEDLRVRAGAVPLHAQFPRDLALQHVPVRRFALAQQ